MGGAFSFAQGGGRGPLLLAPGRVCASWAGAGRAGGLPAAGASSFFCCALNLLFCFTCDKTFAFLLNNLFASLTCVKFLFESLI